MNTTPCWLPASQRAVSSTLPRRDSMRTRCPGCTPNAARSAAVHRGTWGGLQRMEHACAACHAAGVPVLQLPPGDEHYGVFGIRHFRCRDERGGHQLSASVGSGEVVGEHHGLAGVVSTQAGVGHAAFLGQPVPGDAAYCACMAWRISSNTASTPWCTLSAPTRSCRVSP
jgi:hypothetical protein